MNQVMDIVKKNLVSIICGVVVLLAIGAVFWPIGGMFTDLQARADTSKTSHDALNNLLKKTRVIPSPDPNSPEPKPLEHFPTDALIAKGQAMKAEVEKEAKAMLGAAVAINQKDHELIRKDALPGGTPTSANPAREFRTKYLDYMDYASQDPARRAQSMPAKLMGAGMKPTDADIAAEQKRVREDILTNDLARDEKGRPTNQPQVDAKIAAEVPMVPDRLRMTTASQIKVYIDPLSLDVQGQINVNPGLPPSPSSVFWAQVGLWIQEDIARAIAEVNGAAPNVLESTVKRVVKLEVPDEFAKIAAVQTSSEDGAIMPPPEAAGPLVKNFSISPTGRSSNGLYDVVHFKLAVIIDAERVPALLHAISKNRFMSIFRTDITTVDSGAEQLNGYYYGTRPVVMLNMEGEALFLREWLVPLMPKKVKDDLGLSPAPPPQ